MMKSINAYILENLKIKKTTKQDVEKRYFPKDTDELIEIIKNRIKTEGNECNLNDIDISKVDSLCNVFSFSDFNGDISEWDTSNVTSMSSAFYNILHQEKSQNFSL